MLNMGWLETNNTTAMKLKILILSILLSPIFLNAQNSPACDSVFIDCCTFDSPDENTISIIVSNYSSDIFSYPGFILFTEDMDTMAIETVNYYGIGWSQTHIMNIIHPFELPFEGIIELHTGFYESQVCSFPIFIPDSTLTRITKLEADFVKTYPNPVLNTLNIQYEKPQELEEVFISDINGHVISRINNNQSSMNVSHLQAGLYILILKRKEGTTIRTKFIKR